MELNIDTDPELMESFSELMQKIFEEFRDNWNQIYEELEKLRTKIKDTMKQEVTYGLHKQKEMPFFYTLKKEIYGKVDIKLNEDQVADVVSRTQDISKVVLREIVLTDFY